MRKTESFIPLFILFAGLFIFGIVAVGLMQDAEDGVKPSIEEGATAEQIADYEESFDLAGVFIKIIWVLMIVVLALMLGVGVGKFLHMF